MLLPVGLSVPLFLLCECVPSFFLFRHSTQGLELWWTSLIFVRNLQPSLDPSAHRSHLCRSPRLVSLHHAVHARRQRRADLRDLGFNDGGRHSTYVPCLFLVADAAAYEDSPLTLLTPICDVGFESLLCYLSKAVYFVSWAVICGLLVALFDIHLVLPLAHEDLEEEDGSFVDEIRDNLRLLWAGLIGPLRGVQRVCRRKEGAIHLV